MPLDAAAEFGLKMNMKKIFNKTISIRKEIIFFWIIMDS